jgi:predicted house-cleaning noncanonical NTP pyrophosphatase (MazG superfamily)
VKLIRSKSAKEVEGRKKGQIIRLKTHKQKRDAIGLKLIEECMEVVDELSENPTSNLIEEIADLTEVVDAIIHLYSIDPKEISKIKSKKKAKKGDFKEFTFMLSKGIEDVY